MKRPIDRRTVLMSAAVATVGVAAGATAEESTSIRGEINFEGGADIPEGRVRIYLDDPAIQEDARQSSGKMCIESDGKSKSIEFSFSLPAGAKLSPTSEIVAVLEREDGWLLARGSAQFEASSPVYVTLNPAIY